MLCYAWACLTRIQVDLLKNKPLLLDITPELTEGIVNGKRLKVRILAKLLQKETQHKQMEKITELQDGEEQPPNPNNQLLRDLNKEQLRALKSRKGWPHFKDVFMMCATDGEDVKTLKVDAILILYQMYLTWVTRLCR